jgi:AcrR family transcriptional regulator
MVSNVVERRPRIDPRVTRTRRLIRDALTSLLAEKHFESISVQDIAERATVNRATFYAHFSDKFALLDAIVREDFALRLAEGDPRNAHNTRAMLSAVGNSVFTFVGSHRKCRIDRDFEPQFARAMEAELTEFLSPNFGHCTAMLIASALVGAAMNWRHQAPKAPPEPILTNIVGILVDGVDKQKR